MAALGLLAAVIISLQIMPNLVEGTDQVGKPCTYFGGSRVSAQQGNLVNCSWYADNACCKRTEVTSVFGDMYPLFGASEECEHRMNYMMCYFCSPQQYLWYNKRVTVCADFCNSIYEHCRSARYEGVAIGEEYHDGIDFCRGQRFDVVEETNSCFDYDPLVFGRAALAYTGYELLLFLSTMFIITCLLMR